MPRMTASASSTRCRMPDWWRTPSAITGLCIMARARPGICATSICSRPCRRCWRIMARAARRSSGRIIRTWAMPRRRKCRRAANIISANYAGRNFFFLMIRRPTRSTQSRSSAASDVYKRQVDDLKNYIIDKASHAKEAFKSLSSADTELKNAALLKMADTLMESMDYILDANSMDIAKGKEKGMSRALLDRLLLDEFRVKSMAEGLRQISSLQDPVG